MAEIFFGIITWPGHPARLLRFGPRADSGDPPVH
jgi:hypothetical protein